jgi:ABC-type amino acid transport substrate-binding protein
VYRYFILLFFLLPALFAAQPDSTQLRVGVVESTPYAMRDDQGNWTGLAISLWRRVAERAGVTYRFEPVTGIDSLLPLVGRRVDVLLEAPVTANGVGEVDYLFPYHQSTLAVARPQRGDIWRVAKNLLSVQFLKIILSLSVLLIIVGTLVYFLERRDNGEQFGGERTLAQGIGSGFWWAGVTLTTIGYGDKAPTTLGGRIVAMLWMLTALAITASLTAAVVSALNQGNAISFPEDLQDHVIGTTAETSAARYLEREELDVHSFPDASAGLRALQKGDIDYFVDNETAIRYALRQNNSLAASVQPTEERPQAYAIAVERGSPLRDSLSAATISVVLSQSWLRTLDEFGGRR